MTANPDLIEEAAAALREFDLAAQHEGILTADEREGFYQRGAKVVVAVALERAAGVADEFAENRYGGSLHPENRLAATIAKSIRKLAGQ